MSKTQSIHEFRSSELHAKVSYNALYFLEENMDIPRAILELDVKLGRKSFKTDISQILLIKVDYSIRK